MLLYAPGTATGYTRFRDDLAGAVAGRAGLLNREKSLLHPHLALTITRVASLGASARLRTRALAGFTILKGGNANLGFSPARGLLKRDIHVVAQVSTAIDLLPATTAAATAKNFAENIAECFRKSAEAFATVTAAHLRIHTGMSVSIVGAAFFRLGKYFVSFLGFLEFFLCVLAVGVTIWMKFHRQFAIGFFDVLIAGIAIHAENFVEIFFLCHVQSSLMKREGRVEPSRRVRSIPAS